MNSTKVIVTVYSHPEFYPPTLNMITELSNRFDEVFVLSRNVFESDWIYPENVRLFVTGSKVSIRESEKKSNIKKIISFLTYTWGLLKLVIKEKPKWLILCDPIPTFSFQLIKPIIGDKQKLWYHNHDILEVENVNKFSVSWFAYYSEKAIFNKLDIFTLPSDDRREYFPLENFKGKYYLPNYPLLSFISKYQSAKINNSEIRLLFQGSIGPGHGLENIIRILDSRINGKTLKLVLKGFCSDVYRSELLNLAKEFKVTNNLEFYGITSYSEVPKITASCQIGLAIHQGTDIMNSTLGTSSNKIYEYAALGLPVVLYDNQHFKQYLSRYNWCSFTNLKVENILSIVKEIDANFQNISLLAKDQISKQLNFEKHFEIIKLI